MATTEPTPPQNLQPEAPPTAVATMEAVGIPWWILEFVLRNPTVDDAMATAILKSLPPSDSIDRHYRLKKTFLLRCLQSFLSRSVVTELTLRTLELVEELDRENGVKALDSIRVAYCAVAVCCTVRHVEGRFKQAVRRIWNVRIGDLERNKVGLVGNLLGKKRKEMLAALDDPCVRDRLYEDETKAEALECLRVYLDEAFGELGCSFLEFMAEKEIRKKAGNAASVAVLDGEGAEDVDRVKSDGGAIAREEDHLSSEVVVVRDKMVAPLEGRECDAKPPSDMFGPLTKSEVDKAKESLKQSCTALHNAVRDPLPGAVAIAAEVLRGFTGKQPIVGRSENDASQGGKDDPGPSNRGIETSYEEGRDAPRKANATNQPITARPSLMERNPTARTQEWEDSIESSGEKSQSTSKKVHLPSLTKRKTSPLNLRNFPKQAKRRAIKRWSTLEEDTLREGVQRHGKGNWKFILNCYCDIFIDRTEVDLKDKWRNMTR